MFLSVSDLASPWPYTRMSLVILNIISILTLRVFDNQLNFQFFLCFFGLNETSTFFILRDPRFHVS